MSIRINQNPLVIPPRPSEVRPDVAPVPVQGPAASTPTAGVNGTAFKNLTEGVNLQGSASTTSVDSVQRQLALNATYSRLMEEPVMARALNSLRVRDGSALAALGTLLASGKLPLWPDKQAALDKLQQGQPDLFAQIVTLAQQLGLNAPLSADATPSAGATQAAGALSSAQGAYTQAKNTALGLDQQLGRELVSMNPALDGAQRQAYIESFHHAHQAEYNRASQAEADLSTALYNPALDQAAGRDLNVAYAAANAAKTLAGGSHAVDVMKWASRATGEGSVARDMFAQTQNGVSIPGWTGAGTGELRAPVDFADLQRLALGGAAGQLLSEANGDPQAALTNFSAMASALGMDAGRTNELLEGLNQAAAGDYSGLARLANSTDPLAQGLGTAATVFAGLNAKNPSQQAAYAQFLKDTVSQGSAGARMVGNALHSLAKASTSAAKGSAAASQIASSAGALASALKSGDPSMDPFGASSFEDGQSLSALLALAGGSAPPQSDSDSVGDLLTDLGDLSAEPAESPVAQAQEQTQAAADAAEQQSEAAAETSKHQQELQAEDAAATKRQEEREQLEARQTATRQTNRKTERKQVATRQTHRKVEHKQVETRQTQRVEHEAKTEVRGR